jgi:thiamine biosynthesis lipoprotein
MKQGTLDAAATHPPRLRSLRMRKCPVAASQAGDGGAHRFEGRAMGSPLRLTVVDRSGQAGRDASIDSRIATGWESVTASFEAAEQAMSRFRETSDLTAVNRSAGTGRATVVDSLLARALVAADRAGRVTDGRFDARVLEDLDRLGYRGVAVERGEPGREPANQRGLPVPIGETEQAEGRWLIIDRRARMVAVRRPIDLGGIGKGLALRWAAAQIDRIGLMGRGVGILLEAGGDLVGRSPGPDGGDWSIAIEDPEHRDEPKAVIRLTSGAVATSSIAIHRWRDAAGRAVHHLIDPRTGEPGGAGLMSVTVAAADPAWAEVWSKSLFLAGADGIAGLARARGLAAWWVRDDGSVEMTPAARIRTLWSASDS